MRATNMQNKRVEVIKSSGTKERFSPIKLHNSLMRSGLSKERSRQIAKEIANKIKTNSTTQEIYRQALKLVHQESHLASIHYSLKKSLTALGPSGHAFEHFVARYFELIGYKTIVGVTFKGKYITHEVDVVAQKGKERIFAECKFHNNPSHKNDIKTALYVKARWDDLKDGVDGKGLSDFYLISNTAFSEDVIQYSNGVGLKLLGLNAPSEESFLDKIKIHKLYPITCLKRLSKTMKDQLIEKNIITCEELIANISILQKLGLEEEKALLIQKDLSFLLIGDE